MKFKNIKNIIKKNNILNSFIISKAYIEGIYADTPANRKLGRVGMTYQAYAEKLKKEKEEGEEIKEETKKVLTSTPIKTRSLIKSRWNPIAIERDIKKIIPNIKDLKLEKVNYNDSDEDESYYYLSIPKSNVTSEEFNLLKNTVAKYGLSDNNLKNKNKDNYYLESPKWDETGAEVEMSINWPSQKKKLEEKRENISKIKEKVKKEFDKLKKKNDYISLTTKEGTTIRLDRNKENGLFIKAFAKDKEGKVKTFESSTEDILLNSISNYIARENLNLDEENKQQNEVNFEQNNKIIQNVIKTAKENNLGTVIIKASNGNSIYMNRKRVSRWLKDFEAYTIRDSKRNVISQGKAKTEEELINKLNEYLLNNKIQLES